MFSTSPLSEISGGDPFDLLIIGAGPAGLSIANSLSESALRICLIDSGGMDYDRETQGLADGENLGMSYFPLVRSRFLRFGGSMNGWSDREAHPPTQVAPLNPYDFEAKDWVPDSGWPITYSELDEFYDRAQALFSPDGWPYDVEAWENEDAPFLDLDPDALITRLWQIFPRFNLGAKMRDKLATASNIVIALNTSATEIITDDAARRAHGARVKNFAGEVGEVRARMTVLASGGVGNPQLLLLSDRVKNCGLGNDRDLVGRFFMEHPHVTTADIRLRGDRNWLKSYKVRSQRNRLIRAGIGIADQAQADHEILNYSAIVTAPLPRSRGYVAAKMLARSLTGIVKTRRGRLIRDMLFDLPGAAGGLLQYLQGDRAALYTRSEQAPNADSRVTLNAETDSLGRRKADVDWRFKPIDRKTIRVATELIASEFNRLQLGTVVPYPFVLDDNLPLPNEMVGGYHHMGTTRMSAAPEQGVVDPNGRVHGIDGLYVAGSSVFPTGGFANPTLTIVALSLRLADHLQSRLACNTCDCAVRIPESKRVSA